MFPFIGIQADEEPKTPISASGLYNSSDSSSLTASSFSQDLLSGRSEFTFMFWGYIDATSGSFFIKPYIESTAIGESSITVVGSGFELISVSLKNANGGTTSLTANVTVDYQDWFHVAVTGSVLNGRVRAYYNGVLIDSATMTYANAVATSNELNSLSSLVSTAQYNVYDRELTETEVAEHYVYDDDTMSSGVLGWDAMTPAQRSGLIYSSSFTNDISISGNEFNDKSGSGITLSSTPSLTGEQIYFYTNASDLPSDTTIYNVNSATLNGSSQALTITNGNNSIEPSSTDFSMGAWVKGSDTTTTQMIFNRYNASVTKGFDVYVESSDVRFRMESSGSNYSTYSIPATALIDGNLNHLTCNWNQSTQDFTVHVNNSAVATTLVTELGSVQLDFTDCALSFGYREATANLFFNGYMSFGYWKSSAITNTERTELYGSGVPPCFEDLSFSLDGAWNLSTRIGDSDPTTDKMGNGNNLTAIGSPTYTDQGLQVECTS